MNPYLTYQATAGSEWTRIDMLLALFDRAIERLESAAEALKAGQERTGLPLLIKAQMVVTGLASGVSADYHGAADMLRLYEFVTHAISQKTFDQAEAALRVLRNLREGFRAIRAEAVALERSGELPPLHSTCMVRALA